MYRQKMDIPKYILSKPIIFWFPYQNQLIFSKMTFILYNHFNGKPDERLIPPSGFYSTNNGYGNPNVRTKKVAIWSRVTGSLGQNVL